ncbi:hypothetical protein HIM_12412 [Hirsutella minnesotensis 3608]|uniref:Uncharacterized protein n=1 Tax=Hirsutella minnesotensis 3608 TaxID=1043627 RepID=A0A0F8A050_9HYPO|nr:hypothetical protein HIM_12412 [Hirsutella minnesotensis 3608]
MFVVRMNPLLQSLYCHPPVKNPRAEAPDALLEQVTVFRFKYASEGLGYLLRSAVHSILSIISLPAGQRIQQHSPNVEFLCGANLAQRKQDLIQLVARNDEGWMKKIFHKSITDDRNAHRKSHPLRCRRIGCWDRKAILDGPVASDGVPQAHVVQRSFANIAVFRHAMNFRKSSIKTCFTETIA